MEDMTAIYLYVSFKVLKQPLITSDSFSKGRITQKLWGATFHS